MPKSTQLDFIMGLLVETFIINISFSLSISSLMTCLKSSSYSHFTIHYSLFPLARLDIFGRHWLHQLVSSRPRMTKVLDCLDIFCIAAHDSFWFIYHGVSRSPSHHFHLTFLADFKLRDMSLMSYRKIHRKISPIACLNNFFYSKKKSLYAYNDVE